MIAGVPELKFGYAELLDVFQMSVQDFVGANSSMSLSSSSLTSATIKNRAGETI